MLFATPLFLWGLFAVSIPIIIHLIFRIRKRRVIFSTLKFLKVVQAKNARRLRLREWLLLLLRVGAIVCVVLAFARPFREGQSVAAEVLAGRTDVVFVLDDSFSMSAEVKGKTLFEQAKDRVIEHVKRLKLSDRVGLVCTSDPQRPRLRLTDSASTFVSRLRSRTVPQTYGTGDIITALKTASRELKSSLAANRIVVLVSDLQRTGLDLRQLKAEDEAQIPGLRYEVVSLPAAGGNLAVVDAAPQSTIYIPDRRVPFAARVAAFGIRDELRLVVALRQAPGASATGTETGTGAGTPLAQRSVDVAEGHTANVTMTMPLAAAGEMAGWVEIEARDHLAGDDRRYWTARFRERLRVLCVEDRLHPPDERFFDETYALRQALDPRVDEDEQAKRSYIEAREMSAGELTADELFRADVVILCSVTRLDAAQTDALVHFVRTGGGLLLFVGGTDGKGNDWLPGTAFYSSLFTAGVLPARPETPEGELGDPTTARHIATFDDAHPLFAPFRGEFAPLLKLPRIYRTYQLKAEDLARDGVKVLARLDDSQPFIVEKVYGQGRALLVATSAAARANHTDAPDEIWSDFPRHKAYAVLLHQAVKYLSQARRERDKARQVRVGQRIDFGLQPADAAHRLTLFKPDQTRLDITPSDPVFAERPGIYTLMIARGEYVERRYAAANVPPEESDLAAHDAADVAGEFKFSAGRVDNPDEVRTTKLKADSPDELKQKVTAWRWWLLAALGLLLLEALVANVLLRAR